MGLRPETVACPPLPSEDLRHILNHTRGLWEDARGESFFITGGTGFLGMWLVGSLLFINSALELGLKVVVLSRGPERFYSRAPHLLADPALTFIKGDIRTFDFPPGSFKYIIHAATSVQATHSCFERLHLMDEIVAGTRHVCDFAKLANCRNLLLTSSGAVYGNQNARAGGIEECDFSVLDPLCDISTYALSKAISEHIAVLACRNTGTDVKIARCFAFVGPHLPLHGQFAIGNFIRDVMAGGAVKVTGDGSAVRSYLYAADLALWLWTILFRGPGGRAYNVGSTRKVSITALADIVGKELESPFPPKITHAPVIGETLNAYFPKTERATSELGLAEHITLEDAINRTARWYSAPTGLERSA